MIVRDNQVWCPALEVKETSTHLILKAEIPGLKVKDLEIQIERDVLSISGEHHKHNQPSEQELFPSELHYGELKCDFPLPVPVQKDSVRAELVDGILTLMMPKV
ncbi:Hsp20/alpha crystallin family protein [Oscillatoria sp. FACHB-1406]|uniref:Hsp20/alpha crystallin family protein n=1 Tax=Oscillatoria sp. FACHB-1406 TaxID=2692846 RepID=UPI001683FF88|nr:Hsp20/alpha crystallin family protein [Oscillatoria sp. FACHB-1406]MBD2576999.1 Hsp20/alpha crystallin family protein [Oscillatoria sp. FACHB-1406]